MRNGTSSVFTPNAESSPCATWPSISPDTISITSGKLNRYGASWVKSPLREAVTSRRKVCMRTQAEKGRIFRALHERDRAFIIPNPWDVGTARLLVHLGFEALATTSAGYAFSIGRRDYKVGRDEMIH